MNPSMHRSACGSVLLTLLTATSIGAQQRVRVNPPNVPLPPASTRSEANLLDSSVGRSLCQEGKRFYLQVESTRQGKFRGESSARSGWLEGRRFSYQVTAPRDSASGLPTGKRRHSPVSIVKPLDASSPQFFSAAVNNENLKAVTVEFTRRGSDGQDRVYYSIKLTNASIGSIRQFTDCGEEMEEITMFFKTITETHTAGGVTAEDDWATPVM